MKKRYILFGYQIQNGEFCIVQQEGAAVEYSALVQSSCRKGSFSRLADS